MTPAQPIAATPLAPRYSAGIPWIGPIVGATLAGEDGAPARLPLAGAAHPALGPALAAAFVPVVFDAARERYLPCDASGAARALARVGWVQALDCDRDHWFRVDAQASALQGEFAGVLMLLVYGASTHDAPGASAGRGCPIAELPAEMRDEIVARLEALLASEATRALRLALIELPREAPDDAAPAGISFALASCQYPAGFLDRRVAEASYARLAARLDRAGPKPDCLLLVGDQVYVDATAGLFDPHTRFERYVAPHEALFRSEVVRDVLRRLPAYMLLDDHEIDDNWEPSAGDDARRDPNLHKGRRAYLGFQRRAGPPQPPAEGDSPQPLWFGFARRGFRFFMADTRTEREARGAASVSRARIMSETQFAVLLAWLDEQDRDRPKFIATPSILLPRHRRAIQNGHPASALRSDGWDGYPHSLARLLAHIADKQIRNVVFLSGDEHLSCVARATVTSLHTARSVQIYSIHSSPLHGPFPFANSVPEDLVAREDFPFTLPPSESERSAPAPDRERSYRCEVWVERFVDGDGYAVLRAYREGGAWRLDCEFDRGAPNSGDSTGNPVVRLKLEG